MGKTDSKKGYYIIMKRKVFFTVLTAAVLVFTFSFSVFAQYYKDDATGISFVMSDDWSYSDSKNMTGVSGSEIEYRYRF